MEPLFVRISFSLLLEAGAAVGLFVLAAVFPWRDLNRRARLAGSSFLLVAGLWLFTHALEIGLAAAPAKAFLMGLQLVWGLAAMPAWLYYILHYTAAQRGRERKAPLWLGLIPLLALLAVLTNARHGLMWTDPGFNPLHPYLPLQPVYGPLYWACMVYLGAAMLGGGFHIVRRVVQRGRPRRWEPWTLFLASLLPILSGFLEVAGVIQPAGLTIGLTPFFCGLAGILLLASLPRFHLEKVVPAARQTVFQHISDGVVVLDALGRIVDLNPAAERLAGWTIREARGLPVERLWPAWPGVPAAAAPAREEMALTIDGEPRTFVLRTYSASSPGSAAPNRVVLLIDTTEREKADLALRASLREKEVLLREIHHRVKNNMQVISSLLHMTMGQVHDQAVKDVLDESRQRIRSMALVHEQLYRSADLARVGFGDYLSKLYDHLAGVYASTAVRVAVSFDLQDAPLDINTAVPCGLIAAELISNVLKHAFPGERTGRVAIGLRYVEGGRVKLIVADDGIGFPEGLNHRRAHSLGLQIVTLLSGQIGGLVERSDGPGTTFVVTFPAAAP